MAMTLSETRSDGHAVPDPEVPEVAKRRQFTADYKLRIVAEAEKCTKPGELGALLRGEGLYSSHLAEWRKRARGGLINGKRGRKPNDPLIAENDKLRKKNQRLEKRLAQAEAVIELQKKLSEILGIELPSDDNGPTTTDRRRDRCALRCRRECRVHQALQGDRD